ncbi:MAG: hypothetical protein Q4A92_02025 [Corynebacterium sp.]|nr:hypothetical protein [Corynebacterium sp.]
MIERKLVPGQRYVAEGIHELTAKFEISSSNNCGFDFEIPHAEMRKRGSTVAVRNLAKDSEVVIVAEDAAFPSQTTVFITLIFLAADRASETLLEFPPFDVSNLGSFSFCTLRKTPQGIAVDVANLTEDSGLAETSNEVRSIARSMLQEDTTSNVTVIVDVSSSMTRSLSDEQFQAMCQFASGALAMVASQRTLSFCTSAANSRVVQVTCNDIEAIPERKLQFAEVGWNVDMRQIPEGEALVVISDDLPAALAGRKAVHVLAPRTPLAREASYTVFTPEFVRAVQNRSTAILKQDTERMVNTLTGGR